MRPILILLFSLTTIVLTQRSTVEFEIRKKHTNGDKSVRVGKLIVIIQQIYRSVEAEVVSDLNQLVSQEDFVGGHQVILQFTCVQSDLNQYKGRVYLTSVDEIISQAHGQKIAIFLGPTQDQLSIISINYVHSRQRTGQIFTQVVDTKQAQDKLIKYEEDKTKTEAQNQSFFSKYKWPLIIGGVLLYTTMTANPQAAARGGAGAAPAR